MERLEQGNAVTKHIMEYPHILELLSEAPRWILSISHHQSLKHHGVYCQEWRDSSKGTQLQNASWNGIPTPHPRTTVGGTSEMVCNCRHVENSEGPDPPELFITQCPGHDKMSNGCHINLSHQAARSGGKTGPSISQRTNIHNVPIGNIVPWLKAAYEAHLSCSSFFLSFQRRQ